MNTNELLEYFPPMLFGDELDEQLINLPEYDPEIYRADAETRLLHLNRLSNIYIPSQMTREIYSKLYLAMVHSFEKKQTTDAVRQMVQNHKRIIGQDYNSILGGADSFSIIGKSGIGKSTAIAKALNVAGGSEIITVDNPYSKIVPCVNIQCPHDCSVKGMLMSILESVDSALGTGYYERAVKNRSTIDFLIGRVSQVAINHILLIVVDECQNIVRNRHGVNVISALTQLINSSGISICLVGLPETEGFLREEMQLARRSIGLSYKEMDCDDRFIEFCRQVFSYQYVANPVPLSTEIVETLYQCSGGIIGIVLSLLVEAQQVAILSGREEITRDLLLETFRTRLKNIKDFVEPKQKKHPQTAVQVKKKETITGTRVNSGERDGVICVTAEATQGKTEEMLSLLADTGFSITEVPV
ncbi:MAG: ATP-binding protein [Eubacterium sp.]|nr:ATP-binding protein [Eubacterium sp.]